MDRESELVRSENWVELRRFYSARSGHAWELAWIYLLKMRDYGKAVEEFSKTFQDPRYEESSYIVLWKLGKRPSTRRTSGPPSLRLYEAYLRGEWGPLMRFLEATPENKKFAPSILRQIQEGLSHENLQMWSKQELPAATCFQLGLHAERKLRDLTLADTFYTKFYRDPWSVRLSEELSRLIFDGEMSRRLRHAYSKKDGVTVQRVLKTATFRLEKLTDTAASPIWIESLREAFQLDSDELTENLFGYPFWKFQDLSPRAFQKMRDNLFSDESIEEPAFVSKWRRFFDDDEFDQFPSDLDPDALSVWQIQVELNPGVLSDALLRFPMEERFLFLWSLRHRDDNSAKLEPRKWPENQQESEVVRKNLERAFDRSSNKLLWFDRLRKVGCSQNFYEYAVQRSAIPLAWILEDLRSGLIKASTVVRGYLRDQLSLAGPTESEAHKLSAADLSTALGYLTPAETQAVLLSRFVLSPIPKDLLNDDYVDLLWDARSRVSAETSLRWEKEVLDFLSTRRLKEFQGRHWRWIESAWDHDSKELERFAPQLDSGTEFPWAHYLEKLQSNEQTSLLLTCLHRIPDERLREQWISQVVAAGERDHRVFAAINSLSTDYVRHQLLAIWYESKGEYDRAIHHRQEELQQTPILNEQLRIAKTILQIHRQGKFADSKGQVSSILQLAKFLESNGALDGDICEELSQLLESHKEFLLSWKFAIQKWIRSSDAIREALLPRILDLGFRARAVEETQRFLVDQLFKISSPSTLAYALLNALLDEHSFVKLKHLRSELIEKGSSFYPLHRALLEARATQDYRAVLLWDAFYGEDLKSMAPPPSFSGRRRYELWTLTDSVSQSELFGSFTKYLEHVPQDKPESQASDFLEKAERIAQRLCKQFGVRKNLKISLQKELPVPIKIVLSQPALILRGDFFELLDEEIWSALVIGALQLWDDRDKGLFDEKRLLERFFQGMLLSGSPLQKIIRLWVWLAISEGLIEPQVLKARPEQLIENLPFLNSLLIFYLSQNFAEKVQACSLAVS